MRKLCLILTACWLLALLAGTAGAATYQLEGGDTVIGELIPGSADEEGVQIRLDDGRYERVPWAAFKQEHIREFARDTKNRRMAEFAAAFIEITPEERAQLTAVNLNPVPRLERPQSPSLIGGMLSSGVGLVVIGLLYAANLFAAREIAVFRARPVPLVCGISAVAPIIGPIIFLSMPTQIGQSEEALANQPPPETPTLTVPGATSEASAESGGLHLASPAAGGANIPQTQTFQRGAFTFNRRFFETRFAGFFGMVRREADKDMVMLIKSARGQYVATRITRIAANDMHVQVQKGNASEEIMLPFAEIQEVQLKHKDA
ncbi:MAG TPA: hypothetical protein PLH97_09375 [Verrucomicrobiota bacterium]|nr:hypothetical protein [Verrucomicrobiota bacterium]